MFTLLWVALWVAKSGDECNGDVSVRREKALVHSGSHTRPGTGSLHPVAIGAEVKATKPLKPPVQRVASGDLVSL
jgi:hypothetical protein